MTSPNVFDDLSASPVPDSQKTSHSEIETFLKCERMHYYSYGLGIQRKGTLSDALARGILGHAALATYYLSIKGGMDAEDAKIKAIESIVQTVMELPTGASSKIHLEVIDLIGKYVDNYAEQDKNIQVLSVEQEFNIPIGDEFFLKMYIDLILRMPNGELAVWDHKFQWDFLDGPIIGVLPQLPKYVGALKSKGIPVDSAYYNQIRYRSTAANKEDPSLMFNRRRVELTPARIINTMQGQIQAAKRIKYYRDLGVEEWGKRAMCVGNSMICKNCPFLDICAADLAGEDTSLLLEYSYQKKESRDRNG